MDFKNKKVTVMGLGLHRDGSGMAATRFLVERGAKVTVTDLKTAEQLAAPLKRLRGLRPRPKLVLGEHRESDFKNIDLVMKNPGVRNTSKFLAVAVKNKVPIETDISLFFQLIDRKRIIGITGTRGKSTIATLVYEMLKLADRRAVLGGNITKSPLAQMKKIGQGGPVILELSSWMLESLAPAKISPHIAVFTNIYPDHLNTYSAIADYAAAKENIFRYQTAQDYVVLNRDDQWTRAMGRRVSAQRFWFSLEYFGGENGCFVSGGEIYFRRDGKELKILDIKDIKILGQHNIANILAAVCVGMIYGVKPAIIRKAVSRFRGVANRLEFLRELDGVKYYNDTTSTMPEATMAALNALESKKRNIILIAGGSDKGLDFRELAKKIKKNCKALVLLKGTGTARLKKVLRVTGYGLRVTEVASMSEAVKMARGFAKKGDVILLSPACASFGMFENEFDRGDQFRRLVDKLKSKKLKGKRKS